MDERMMRPTSSDEINALLGVLLARIQAVLGAKLVGLYLYGSLVTGDFDHETSDIDLVAAISTDRDEQEFAALQTFHHEFIEQHPTWDERLEIAYISLAALQTFREQPREIAVISPGEPFHRKEAGRVAPHLTVEYFWLRNNPKVVPLSCGGQPPRPICCGSHRANVPRVGASLSGTNRPLPDSTFNWGATAGRDWTINWYIVREYGVTLFGAAPQTIIAPIAQAEFIAAVREQAKEWREWVYHGPKRGSQAYAILTMCRALYAHTTGEQVSKRQAALWAAQQLPEWATLIENALVWRKTWRDEPIDHQTTFPETVRFVHFVIDQIVGASP
jgi:hypothetical protein